jgi:putative ABC transport system permease protein
MKFLPLVWKNIWRKKTRTIFTLMILFIAFFLYGVLMAIRMAFTFGVDIAGIDRLVLISKISLIMPLPISYLPRLQAAPGVEIATHNTWFGGYFQDPGNFFAQIVVDPEPFMTIYKEFELPAEQMQAWLNDRQGAVVGRGLAERFEWSIGDRVPLIATIWQPKGGGQTWEFNIVGIYDGGEGVDTTQFFFRYDYLDENRAGGQGAIGWFVVKIADPSQSQAMAARFDEMFANSSAETKTTTEKGFVEGFAKQMGDIGAIVIAILTAVLFMFGLNVANTMAQSVRERTNELAVLKTVGFSGPTILLLVMAESLFVTLLGGGLGLLVSWMFVQAGDPTGGMLPIWALPARDVGLGVGLLVLLALVAGWMPAWGAMRLRITDALRRA